MIKFQVKEQLNAIEERRLEDMERTERKNADAQKKLEQILNRHVALMSWMIHKVLITIYKAGQKSGP